MDWPGPIRPNAKGSVEWTCGQYWYKQKWTGRAALVSMGNSSDDVG